MYCPPETLPVSMIKICRFAFASPSCPCLWIRPAIHSRSRAHVVKGNTLGGCAACDRPGTSPSRQHLRRPPMRNGQSLRHCVGLCLPTAPACRSGNTSSSGHKSPTASSPDHSLFRPPPCIPHRLSRTPHRFARHPPAGSHPGCHASCPPARRFPEGGEGRRNGGTQHGIDSLRP